MKKAIATILAVVMSLSVIMPIQIFAEGELTTYPDAIAEAETFLSSNSSQKDANYGTKANTYFDSQRMSLMRFTLPTLTGDDTEEVKTAVIKAYLVNDAPATAVKYNVSRYPSDTWVESEITYNNAGDFGTAIEKTYPGGGLKSSYIELDVTEVVKAEYEKVTYDKISIFLSSGTGFAGKIDMRTKEFKNVDPAQQPRLIVTTGAKEEVVVDPNQEIVDLAADALSLSNIGAVVNDLSLPLTAENGISVSWESANTAVISTSGVVTRPSAASDNVNVLLTATLTKGNASAKKTFLATVLSKKYPVDDVMADANKPDDNYGTLEYMTLKSTSPYRQGYLKFDVSGIDEAITNATVRVTTTTAISTVDLEDAAYFIPQYLKLYEVADNSWTEMTLVENNKPKTGRLVATAETTDNERIFNFNITDYAQEKALSEDKMVSLTLVYEYPSETAFRFGTKENATENRKPIITLETSNDADVVAATNDKAAIVFSDTNRVINPYKLPTVGGNGSIISWQSSDVNVYNTETNTVTRGSTDQSVTLTATITNNQTVLTKLFNLTVPNMVNKLINKDSSLEIDKLSGALAGTDITVLTNFVSSVSTQAIMIVAQYGENGLCDINTGEAKNITAGNIEEFTLDIQKNADCKTIKVYIWDGLTNFKPVLSDTIEFR